MKDPYNKQTIRSWIHLTFIAGLPRILAAFFLPNAFGDAYSYIREIEVVSAKLSSATFALTDLYGFWLPLYQFICAVIVAFTGHAYFVAKLVSAVFGVGICLPVYQISLKLTHNHRAAFLAFLLIALSPLHVFNSASSMTDIPHAFFVLAGVYFVLEKRWITAAVFVAFAGLTRVDSWLIIPLIPAIQFFEDRRVSITACLMLIFPPLFWFYVSWKATGDWMACFVARKEYMDWLLAVNPELASFSLKGIARDAGALLLSTDLAVLIACCFAGWYVTRRLVFKRKLKAAPADSESSGSNARSEELSGTAKLCVLFFAFLGFLVLAYLTHKQPIIFPRYGLILFALGVPVLAWAVVTVKRVRPQIARKLVTAVVTICLLNAGVQLGYSVGYINRELTHRAVADYLHSHYQSGSDTRIFSDDGTVVALSGLPAETFLSSSDAPRQRETFLQFLVEKKVEYLVYVDQPGSLLPTLFPEFANEVNGGVITLVMRRRSRFLPSEILLYRIETSPRSPKRIEQKSSP
jgi:hypothetical protein